MTIAALTGHRPPSLDGDYTYKSSLSKKIISTLEEVIVREEVEYGITGMAQGADQLWACALINKKIPFTAAIPFYGQELWWAKSSKNLYREILKRATKIEVICRGTSIQAFQQRNEWMVNNSTFLTALWNEDKKGGTWNCIQYAKSKKKRIIYINPKDLL